MQDLHERMQHMVEQLQQHICTTLESTDGRGRFQVDAWERPGGGGGVSSVMEGGRVFEKAGVNISAVHGELPATFAARVGGTGQQFRATGLSLVLHPRNPICPTVHANIRFLEQGAQRWFGGGADLTPAYLFREDAAHFHRTLKAACDAHHPDYYPRFKAWCDEYFFLTHRQETRGVGGIFFDHLGRDEPPGADLSSLLGFVQSVGHAVMPAYLPLVERRANLAYTAQHRAHQLWRRGRYVEFNLLQDRGTVFGLQTGGRTESILMSLPPLARWEYGHIPAPGTPERELVDNLHPQDWLAQSE